jgi:hypothetical protein
MTDTKEKVTKAFRKTSASALIKISDGYLNFLSFTTKIK